MVSRGVQPNWEGELSLLMVSSPGSSKNRVPLSSHSHPLFLLTASGSRPQQPVWGTVLWIVLGYTSFRAALRALPNTGIGESQ